MKDISGSVIYVIGAFIEITGIMFMSHKYINALIRQVPMILISAIWRGKLAAKSAVLPEITVESSLTTLQGLALVALGFFIKSTPELYEIISHLLEIIASYFR